MRGPKQPKRADVRPEELAAYDRVVGRQTNYGYGAATPGYEIRPSDEIAGPYFGPLLQSPMIADYLSELGVVYRTRGEVEGSFQHKDREWVDMVIGLYTGFNTVEHTADAVAVGVRPEAIIALHEGREQDLTEVERRLTNYIRAVAGGTVTDEDWAWAVGHFTLRGAVEYSALIAHLLLTFRLMQVFMSNTRATSAEVIAQAKEAMSGKLALDGKARIPTLEYVAPAQ
jgi:hypothetical protein